MALAVTPEEVLHNLSRLPAERQRVAFEFIRFPAQEQEPDEEVDVHQEVVRALDEVRTGRVDRRDWRTVLDEL